VDFSQAGNQNILYQLGASVGLTSSSTTSTAVVILSNVIYVDSGQCMLANAWTAPSTPQGPPPNNTVCTNYQSWAFTQRLVFGNSSLRTSNLGTPPSSIVNSTSGQISVNDYATNAADKVYFYGGSTTNPYFSTGATPDLPSGQTLYVAEASSLAFKMPPFFGNQATYSINYF